MADNEKEFLIRVRADINKALTDLKKLGDGLDGAGKKGRDSGKGFDGASKSLGRLTQAAAAYFSIRTAINIIKQADAFQVLDQRIRTATKATGDYAAVSDELYRISNANGVALNETVSLFQNLARTAPELGATNEQVLTLSNSIQQLGVIGGSTKSQLQAGLLQFSQGLAGGVFRAEEFNSIIENLPEVANRIAKGMGLTVGQLRRSVIEGKALSQDVFNSILKQSEDINDEFTGIPTSLERATTALLNSAQRLAGAANQKGGITSGIASFFDSFREGLDVATAQLDNSSLEGQLLLLEKYNELIDTAFEQNIPFFSKHDVDRALENINEINARIDELRKTADEAKTSAEGAIKPIETNKNQEGIDKLIEKLRTTRDTTRLTKEEAILFELNLQHASDSEIELARSMVGAIEAHEKQTALMAEGNQIIADTRTEMENLATTLDHLDQLYEQGAFGIVGSTQAMETYARAVFDAQEKTEDFGDKNKDTFSELEAAVKGWGNEFTDTLTEMVVKGKGSFKDLADAIISDILRILIYQNLVRPTLGFFGVDVGTNHSGGLAGTGPSRTVSPLAFAGAPRYHTGGLAGLKRNEVPAILQKGEEVLTTNDPRHAFNQGAGSGLRVEVINKGTPAEATQANTRFDAGDLVVSVVLDDLDRGGRITNKLDSRFGRR